MESLAGAVLRLGADLGVIFDADCDRAAIVDRAGREINRNRLIALISAILLENDPRATIVTGRLRLPRVDSFRSGTACIYRYKRGPTAM